MNWTERSDRVVSSPAYTRKVSGSNLGPEIGFPDTYRGFNQPLQANTE
jgi:hypothetical protein